MLRLSGPAPTQTLTGRRACRAAIRYIASSRIGPGPTFPLASTPPQLFRMSASTASAPAAIGLGSFAGSKPARRSYQYQVNEPIEPP